MTYASTWPDVDRHVGFGMGATRGRTGRRNPARRGGLVCAQAGAFPGSVVEMTVVDIFTSFNSCF